MFVLHADADAFFASVEQRDDPRLRGRPVIVGGGVVLAASYEAKAYGIRTAMGGRQARRLCPDAIVVPPRFSAYTEASRALFAVFEDLSPVVEGLSIDEAFLDVRGMERIAGTPAQIAVRLRAAVRERVGLPVTVGVARTKFLAKVASGVAKPDGLLVVPPERELAFLHPLPVECVWGVGPATARRLQAWNVRTVGELAALSEPTLVAMLGRAAGRQLNALAHNRDFRRVEPGRRRGSIGSQRALGRGRHSAEAIDATLVAIVDRITRRMRTARRVGRTVVLRLRFGDFERATRSHTLPFATASTQAILDHGSCPPRDGDAVDRAARHHARRLLGRDARGRPDAAAPARAGGGSRRRRRRDPRPLRQRGDHARRPARPRPGLLYAVAAGLRIPA